MEKNKYKYFLFSIAGLLRQALGELLKNDPLRMAGATAFFYHFCPAADTGNPDPVS